MKKQLETLSLDSNAELIQKAVYEVGKNHEYFKSLKDWFKALYQILLGQDTGPRMGSFIALYGIKEILNILEKGLFELQITS